MSRLDARAVARYRRQLTLAGFGRAGQEALAGAHVAVLGAGGLGSPALLYLAGAGVGRITVIDDDLVDLSNLHRQVIHATARIGEPKADSARAAMLALNPDIEVRAVRARLTPANAAEVLDDAAVLLDGADNFAARHTASWACARAGIPHVWGSILGFEAQMSVFDATRGPVYEDLFPAPPAPGSVPSCAQAGVLGPVVGQVGSAMAMEALKVVTGVGDVLCGSLGYLDSLVGRWEYVPLVGDPEVARRVAAGEFLVDGSAVGDAVSGGASVEEPGDGADRAGAAGGSAAGGAGAGGAAAGEAGVAGVGERQVREVSEIPEGAVLLDVRDDSEYEAFHMPGAVHVPLPDLLAGRDPELPETAEDAPVVVYCAGGVRSALAVQTLTDRGFEGLVSLRGGIDAWLDRHGTDGAR
ncbi:molybdopterin biosynthesis protein MoeB [Corynebacterium frankenforstense DSM 45800]|uniref:Molybdopterin biosynthesis protein MoeB n=1 Tax=Corynebacterium frankenforstense DSM 45800 TaxID=1437875 RepID=A0A1L7CS69_9CORY|nr:ThiF family adenylyltransferase [Corynebacterium frankenforstense]APT88682.1 molybdopterin biosynthesis protein MoeB [Corynebacterium frankenforstense DSM 45800]